MDQQPFDLEERLVKYSVRITRLIESLPSRKAANHVASQLLRSGTSPMAHHGEAQAAESRKDFIHKLGIAHKELRESSRWLKLIEQVPLIEDVTETREMIQETEELIRIFRASINTTKR